MKWLALDIGGANIKVADGCGFSASYPFALWKNSDRLENELRRIISESPESDHLIATMTGELADCFETKKEGVSFIVQSLAENVSPDCFSVYQTSGQFVNASEAIQNWRETAASNWHAFAACAARFLPNQTGIVIDIGSTTTDLIPVQDGAVASDSMTDIERLMSNELVYTGISRTPVCSLIDAVNCNGQRTLVAKELFASTLDAHLLVGNIESSKSNDATADGRPANVHHAAQRLARMLCADLEELDWSTIEALAEQTIQAQINLIKGALQNVKSRFPDCGKGFLVSGSGDWLAKQVLGTDKRRVHVLELAKLESRSISDCGPAWAVATLLKEVRSK